MSDKRSVSTDALATLGTIIDDTQKRDAIHLAVEPVIAGERLLPGDSVTVVDGVAHSADEGDALGIVDPFLTKQVRKGQRFWFVMYPRMVHSLRHVWTHPAFPDESGVSAPKPSPEPVEADKAVSAEVKAASEAWLRTFINNSDCPGYETVIGAIADGDVDDDSLHFEDKDAHGNIPPEFWTHVEIVLGRKLANHPTFFSCSC